MAGFLRKKSKLTQESKSSTTSTRQAQSSSPPKTSNVPPLFSKFSTQGTPEKTPVRNVSGPMLLSSNSRRDVQHTARPLHDRAGQTGNVNGQTTVSTSGYGQGEKDIDTRQGQSQPSALGTVGASYKIITQISSQPRNNSDFQQRVPSSSKLTRPASRAPVFDKPLPAGPVSSNADPLSNTPPFYAVPSNHRPSTRVSSSVNQKSSTPSIRNDKSPPQSVSTSPSASRQARGSQYVADVEPLRNPRRVSVTSTRPPPTRSAPVYQSQSRAASQEYLVSPAHRNHNVPPSTQAPMNRKPSSVYGETPQQLTSRSASRVPSNQNLRHQQPLSSYPNSFYSGSRTSLVGNDPTPYQSGQYGMSSPPTSFNNYSSHSNAPIPPPSVSVSDSICFRNDLVPIWVAGTSYFWLDGIALPALVTMIVRDRREPFLL